MRRGIPGVVDGRVSVAAGAGKRNLFSGAASVCTTLRIILALCAAAGFSVFAGLPVRAQAIDTIYNVKLPVVIRVAIRAGNNPRGPILWVQTIGFQQYCTDVLPNEWIPSWDPQALEAGAMAVKMFAWYHTLHPVTVGGFTFDVDNTVNFQEFRFLSGRVETDRALTITWPYAYTDSNGTIAALDYRAGIPDNPNWPFIGSQKMAQWGSQYWAMTGASYLRILNLYFPGRTLFSIPGYLSLQN